MVVADLQIWHQLPRYQTTWYHDNVAYLIITMGIHTPFPSRKSQIDMFLKSLDEYVDVNV